MDTELVKSFRKNLESKSIGDLKEILDTYDKKLFSPEFFEALRQEMMERQPQSKGFNGSNNQDAKKDAANGITSAKYTSKYKTARSIARFASAVGFIFSVIGVFSLILFVISIIKKNEDMSSLTAAFVCLFAGLTLVMAGQMAQATLDTADNTGEMLFILKNKDGIS
ncbi:MAG: hypothetical protein AB2L12_13765 [Smithellaceae bacterium]|mgnify:CR=1 FL=1